jgi:HlyD family secretion protein
MKPDIFSSAQALLRRVSDSLKVEPGVDADATAAKRRRRLVIAGLGTIVLVAGSIYALTHFGKPEPVILTPAERAQAVTVAPLGAHAFTPTVALQGEARPRQDYRVVAPSSGVRILALMADEGDYVRAGQPLARLDAAVSNAQTLSAQAGVASAQAAQRRAADEYRRAESIRDSGALSTEAIEQRRSAAAAADAQLAAARAQLAEVNARLQGGFVRAPAAGLVIQRMAEIGRPVDGQVLFRIAGDNSLEVAAEVAESDVLSMRTGQRATFQLVNGETVDAVLSRIPASIDSRTRTGQALFTLPRGSSVRAGMYLRGSAQLAPREAPAVPQAAILYEGGQAYVFIVAQETRQGEQMTVARRAPVQVGLRSDSMVEITGGLDTDAQVIGAGAAFLQDGDRIRPITRAAASEQPAGEEAADPDLRGRAG